MLLAALASSPAAAQPDRLRFDHLTVQDGLSHDTVWDIHQDRFGFLWFATADGLSRYDGRNFKIWKHDPDDPDTPVDSETFRLLEREDGSLWLGTRNHGVSLFDRPNQSFQNFLPDADDPETLLPGLVLALHEDPEGNLWVGSAGGLSLLRPDTGRVTRYAHDPDNPESSIGSGDVGGILDDGNAGLWLATGDGLDHLDLQKGSFRQWRGIGGEEPGTAVNTLGAAPGGGLWLATGDGLYLFDPQTSSFEHWFEEIPKDQRNLWSLLVTPEGNVWAGGPLGLWQIEKATRKVQLHPHDPADPASLGSNNVVSLTLDRTGILWIATHGGANKYDPRKDRFATWHHRPGDPTGLSGTSVLTVAEDRRGRIWAGTLDDGLNRIDRETGEVTWFLPDPDTEGAVPEGTVREVIVDRDDNVWASTNNGLVRIDADTERLRVLRHDPEDPESTKNTLFSALVELPDERILVAAGDTGLERIDSRSGRGLGPLGPPPRTPNGPLDTFAYDLLVDRKGTLWVATDLGLSRLDRGTESFRHYLSDREDRSTLSHSSVVVLFEDSRGILWVGTYGGGLNRFHPEDETFTHFRTRDGLPNDAVVAITEDPLGDLWLGTNQGLSRFDPRSSTFRNYDSRDGIAGEVFGIGAAIQTSTGSLLVGAEGLTEIFPQRLSPDLQPPAVVLTDFHLFYESAPLARQRAGSPLERSILYTPELVLNHRQYVFALEFAGLHFANPERNRLLYRLKGFDEDWVEAETGADRARYSNLAPGDYRFQVRAANADGVWTTEQIDLPLTVLPPPWKTWWAYSLYALILCLVLGSGLQWQQNRVRRERRINERLREVDHLKDEFLANTSHELRTPLYGIIGLAEALQEGVAGDIAPKVRSHLGMIIASGQRLSSLVNDILDFSKLSRHSLELERRPVDLHSLTEVVFTVSGPLVGDKELELSNAIDPALPPAHADENRLQQILLNLTSNAIKFTERGVVEVSAVAEEGRLEMRVRDTGIGIPEGDLERIFESFEQVDASLDRVHGGTGLGLAVTRQLVGLHGGNLWVESTPGTGSTFYFTLPIADAPSADAPAPAELEPPPEVLLPSVEEHQPKPLKAHEGLGDEASKYLVMVVDDEPVIREVLSASLEAEGYRVLVATGGPEALELLEQERVDLVLLDVMMPRVSGYEVLNVLRQKYSLEELPVIFLTARTQVSDVLTGFSAGANDYLAKPVARGELLARVQTHLQLYSQHRVRADRLKVLSGLLPICGSCQKIRDSDGYWSDLGAYLEEHSEAELSHGLCPDCLRTYYPEAPRTPKASD